MAGLRAAWCMWAASLVLLIGSGFAGAARAQDAQQTALARTLFEEGVSLADHGDWVGAADRFERAHSLKPTPGIAFNWASALRETGKLVHAQELLLSVTRDAHADPELRAQAEQALAALTPRIARLKVHVASTETSEQVRVDGATWPRAAWDVWSPIDPGVHRVQLEREGQPLQQLEVTLADGEQRELALSEHARPTLSGPEETPANTHAAPRRLKRWVWWGAAGVVVVGAVVAGVVIATRREPQSASPITGNATPGVLRW